YIFLTLQIGLIFILQLIMASNDNIGQKEVYHARIGATYHRRRRKDRCGFQRRKERSRKMEAKTKGNVRPFGMADKIGYAFGDFGNDFTFMLSSMFMMKFYTDVMGVAPGIVGGLMMAARFVDAVTDVTM